MNQITLNLLDGEVKDIINVLGQLPTNSNAWPLVQKIGAQLTAQTPEPTEPPKDIS
jgi:hypothetical protein